MTMRLSVGIGVFAVVATPALAQSGGPAAGRVGQAPDGSSRGSSQSVGMSMPTCRAASRMVVPAATDPARPSIVTRIVFTPAMLAGFPRPRRESACKAGAVGRGIIRCRWGQLREGRRSRRNLAREQSSPTSCGRASRAAAQC